ncbi:flavodoxin [Sporosarcina sp. Marseille-Q4063]|uniref:flavodoxin n=1 Tax=Sporosarcina sp. Marseille-Q4063 TaxID=2810514 RepID=UPI001BB0B878|nr:flavodoxin [Sporosarcina sp. Marseille-Q4063]QUW21020.1 flavodoxin [Sporosarcina sp. Marseille-Q4063]
MVSFLIAYATWSGNTEEVAELIEENLLKSNMDVTRYRIGTGPLPNVNDYDALIIGSFTWDKGATPDEVKDFVAEVGYKPPNVYVFGTGDTQFGGDALFCSAAVKLARFYESNYAPLKIEQSPRGTQETDVINWTEGVIKQWSH